MSTIGYYICVPFAWILRTFYELTGSYGWALVLFTLVVKLITLPFQMKSKKSMMRMNLFQPKMKEIQTKYANNPQRMNEEMQLLYTQERWYGLVDVLRAALAITERPRTYICEADAWGSLPYDLLSLAYAHLGDAESAADACRNAVERSPQEERLRKNLALFEQMRER